MKRSMKIISAIALTVGIAGGTAAYGNHQHGDMEKRADKIAAYIANELSLDDTQQQTLDALKTEVMEVRQNIHTDKATMKNQLNTLVNAEIFDRTAALELFDAKITTMDSQAPEVVDALGNFLDGLNIEQKAKIQEFMESRRGLKRFRH